MITVLLTMMAILVSQPSPGSALDGRAEDAFQLFSRFCVSTGGQRADALSFFGNGNILSNKLPAATSDALLGQSGTVGWAVRSPAGAFLMLGYGNKNHCEVRISEAQEATVIAYFDALRTAFKPQPADVKNPEARVEDGVTKTFRGFRAKLGEQRATFAMTTSNKRVGEQQHLLTFDMPNP